MQLLISVRDGGLHYLTALISRLTEEVPHDIDRRYRGQRACSDARLGYRSLCHDIPAIPADVKSITFSEGFANGYQLAGIDLTGTLDYNVNIGKLPSDVRKPFADGALPDPVLKYDSTTVNMHLLGYKPEMGGVSYFLFSSHGYDKTR